MKRLAGTVLGLLFAQVCCELGLPHREPEGVRRCSIVEGGRGADKSCRLSILIIYGSCVCGEGSLPRFCQSYSDLLLWLFLFSSGVRQDVVEQSPAALNLQEGASHVLRCNFSASVNNVQWYLQNPNDGLIHLFYIPSGTKQEGRLKATTVPAERSSSLHISSPWTTDSGTYFCGSQHGAPQAPAASTRTLPGLSPSSSLSHTVRPPQGICSADCFLPALVQS